MADINSDDSSQMSSSSKMGAGDPTGNSTKHDNLSDISPEPEEFKICSTSSPPRMANINPTDTDNKLEKSILKPSLLTSTTGSFVLRQSGFNPFNNFSNDVNKKDSNSDKKQLNGEVKFVPLVKKESQASKPPEPGAPAVMAGTPVTSSNSFIFGQNLQERVISSVEPLASTSTITSNGNSSNSSDMLFSSAVKSEVKSDSVNKESGKSLTESAREYEELRANKRKYDEVQVKTGEEEETNILSISCKLFAFDNMSSNWQERGRGTLRLNDFDLGNDQVGSRLVFRATGSLRVILNTKIWAEMTIDKASEKSVRLTAQDSSGEIKVFLIMSSIEDSRQLYGHLQSRLEKEVTSSQKRKKMALDNYQAK